MKRIGLALVPLLLTAATAASQGVRYGVGAGLLLPVGDYHSIDKPGWTAGVDVSYFLEGKVTNVVVNGVYYVSIPIRVGLRFGTK